MNKKISRNSSSRSHRRKLNKKMNLGIARTIPFSEDLVFGNHIDQDSLSAYFKRHVFPLQPKECPFCRALLFFNEPKNICCENGNVVLPPIREHPTILENYYKTAREKDIFLENIRAFNNALALASLQVDIDEELATKKSGVYTFRAQGYLNLLFSY